MFIAGTLVSGSGQVIKPVREFSSSSLNSCDPWPSIPPRRTAPVHFHRNLRDFNELLRGAARLALFNQMQEEVLALCGPAYGSPADATHRRAGWPAGSKSVASVRSAVSKRWVTKSAEMLEGFPLHLRPPFITRHGVEIASDLEVRWRRIVLSIFVRNTDDHLRNHGFMLHEQGWKLALAYDINPDPNGRGLSLNITEDDNSLDLALALEVAPYFQLKAAQAEEILSDVCSAVGQWRNVADGIGLPRSEIEELGQTLES